VKRVLLVPLFVLLLAAPAQAATKVRQYRAWTAIGNPTVKHWVHGDGNCNRASRVSARNDAWRCTSGSVTLDPCFLSPTDEEVVCVTAPWARRGYLLTALIDPDSHGSSNAPDAWALRVRGRRCSYIPGPARRRAAASPRGGGQNLFGPLNRRSKTWTIRIGSNRRSARRARVGTAWT
jgi:hypothetical protein